MNKKLLELLQKQISIELGNSALYRQASGIANKLGFLGAEKWLKRQAEDELIHYNKIFDYLLDRNESPEIRQIVEPTRGFQTLLSIYEAALEREKNTTTEIKKIRQEAINADDQLTEVFMNWFISEQIEEESAIFDILAQLKVASDNPGALLLIDEKLGED